MTVSTLMPASEPISLAVVGGGMGGLCLAIGLLKNSNIRLQVYEAASKFSEIGAGVALGPNAQRALRLISPEAEQAFLSQATGNMTPELAHSWFEFRRATGPYENELLANVENSTGQATVHRAKFLDELVKLVPSDIVHFGKRLETVKENGPLKGVTLDFLDGTSTTVDCVIGADGIHSAVRKFLLGPDHPATEPRFTGSVAYRGLVPMELAREKLGKEYVDDARMWCGDNGMVMSYPIDHGATLNIVATRDGKATWDAPTSVLPVTKEECRLGFADWTPKARQVVELIEDPKCWAFFEHPHAPFYHRRQVAMLGDAAHSTTPYQGAGAGQAIEDALVLSSIFHHVVSFDQIEPALAAYDEVRRGRTQRVVDTSREAGRLYAFTDSVVKGSTRAFRRTFEARMSWLWDIDLFEQNAQTLRTFDLLQGYQKARTAPSANELRHTLVSRVEAL